ncbi:MAG: hypothetical protein EOO46_18880 [Flavobacterium sp.]|nr:MAG: hypothetical protein EOO46_18880 [Flavobacterium sp.]
MEKAPDFTSNLAGAISGSYFLGRKHKDWREIYGASSLCDRESCKTKFPGAQNLKASFYNRISNWAQCRLFGDRLESNASRILAVAAFRSESSLPNDYEVMEIVRTFYLKPAIDKMRCYRLALFFK